MSTTDRLDARLGSSHNASLVHHHWVRGWATRGVVLADLRGRFAPAPTALKERLAHDEQVVLEAWAKKQEALKREEREREAREAAERVRAKVAAMKKNRHRGIKT